MVHVAAENSTIDAQQLQTQNGEQWSAWLVDFESQPVFEYDVVVEDE